MFAVIVVAKGAVVVVSVVALVVVNMRAGLFADTSATPSKAHSTPFMERGRTAKERRGRSQPYMSERRDKPNCPAIMHTKKWNIQ